MEDPAVPDATLQTTAPVLRPRELALSAAWNAGFARELISVTGQNLTVVYPGTWSHGFGPDFLDAMIEVNGSFVSGSVEIHTSSSDWFAHGHHLDERYNDVILHIVTTNDVSETRCANGRSVPTALLNVSDSALFQIDRRLPDVWSHIGGSVCAEHLARKQPAAVREALWQLGDERFRERTVAIEGAFAERNDPHDVLLRLLLDGFGYSENRGPMRQLADLLARYRVTSDPRLKRADRPSPWLIGVMLGLGGFLPLSPSDAHAGGILPEDQYVIERAWRQSAAAFADDFIPATSWQMARVRPANHPVFRIMQAATLITRTGPDVVTPLVERIRTGGSVVEWLQQQTARPWHPGLGAGRATAITASAVLPFARALAAWTEDVSLAEVVDSAWNRTKHTEWTRPAKRARQQVCADVPLRGLGERGHQGLLHLDRSYCRPRRCSVCPIARAVVQDQTSSAYISDQSVEPT